MGFGMLRTHLKVVDNSGEKRVIGRHNSCISKGIPTWRQSEERRCCLRRCCRCDGSELKFDDNAVVLVNKQGEPIGTRVFGPVPHELRKKKHVKILSLAEYIA